MVPAFLAFLRPGSAGVRRGEEIAMEGNLQILSIVKDKGCDFFVSLKIQNTIEEEERGI